MATIELVRVTLEGGAAATFSNPDQIVELRDGSGAALARDLKQGDVFRVRSGFDEHAWAMAAADASLEEVEI